MQWKIFSKIWKENIEKAFSSFCSLDNFRTKDEQDQYLQSLILVDAVAVKRRRKSTRDRLQNDGEDSKESFRMSITYFF